MIPPIKGFYSRAMHLPRSSLFTSLEQIPSLTITTADSPKIPQMRISIQRKQIHGHHIPRIPLSVHLTALQHRDICRRDIHLVRTGNPVLRPNILEPHQAWRQPGHRVIDMRDAVVRPIPTRVDEVRDLLSSNARTTIRVQIDRGTSRPH